MREATKCREPSCRADIVYLRTKTGKQMPVDASTVEAEDDLYVPERHSSHFKTCTAPNKFSKGNR